MDAGTQRGAAPPGPVPASAVRLGPYRLLHVIGGGGMGVVHLGLDPAGRAVAVKVLRPHVAAEPTARARLAREVETLRRVRSPRVAEVLDADPDAEQPYLVTQFVPAPPLDAHVEALGPLAGADLARLATGLGDALAAIHAAGVVHRDLKPGNVLVLDGEPVVIDFGIAQIADDVRLTSAGLVMGTPGYLSPEVLDGGAVTPTADWWGWAATTAFAATGRPPFGTGPTEAVLSRVRRGVADLDGAPPALASVLSAALAPDPADRPPPRRLREAVHTLVAGTGAHPSVLHRATGPRGDHDPAAARDQADATIAVPAETMVLPGAEPTTVLPGATTPLPFPRASDTPSPVPEDPVPEAPVAPVAPVAPARPASRSGTLAAALAALVASAAVVPVVAAIAVVVVVLVARTTDRSAAAVARRRYERGPRRSDGALTALALPGHLLSAAVAGLPALLLPALMAASAAFVIAWAADPQSPAPGQPLPLAAGAVSGALTAWWGPGSASVRRGARLAVRATSPGQRGPLVVVVLLVLVALAAVSVALTGGQPDWTPLARAPLG